MAAKHADALIREPAPPCDIESMVFAPYRSGVV
jgi:hypothetical protein